MSSWSPRNRNRYRNIAVFLSTVVTAGWWSSTLWTWTRGTLRCTKYSWLKTSRRGFWRGATSRRTRTRASWHRFWSTIASRLKASRGWLWAWGRLWTRAWWLKSPRGFKATTASSLWCSIYYTAGWPPRKYINYIWCKNIYRYK